MAKLSRLAGSTSHILTLFIQDSTRTDGGGLAGLLASGLTCYYKRNTGTASVAVTLTGTGTLGTYTSGLFKEIDGTNLPGFYEFHPPDAAYASGAKSVAFLLKGGTNMVVSPLEVELTGTDNQDGVRGGMTALPNAAANAANGLMTLGTGSGQINAASGKVPATVATLDGVDSATLLTRLTAIRASYLDNLNTGGPVASHADVLAINTSSSKHLILTTVGQYERPESGSTTYTVECRTFSAADGGAVNADTTPTLTATGIVSGSLAANLSAATNPATGVYRWTYTVASGATIEQVRFDVSASIASSTSTLSAYTQVADFVASTFTAADRTLITDTNTRALLALPAAAPGQADGLPILGTNTAGLTLNPASGPALQLLSPTDNVVVVQFTGADPTGTAGLLVASADVGVKVGAGVGVDITGTNSAVNLSSASASAPVVSINTASSGATGLSVSAGTGVTITASSGDAVRATAGGTGAGFGLVGGSGGGHGLKLARGSAGADDVFLTNSDAPTLAAPVADRLLGRNLAGGSDGGRTVQDALRAARNKVVFDVPGPGQFAVMAEDDVTPAWTGTYQRGSNTLGPLTATDPA